MICKILSLPFRVLMQIPCAIIGIIKMALGVAIGVVSFLVNHITGTLLGALIGFLLGRKHVGIKTAKKKS